MVTVSFQLPESVEEQLRSQLGDVSAATKEAALVELYRQGKLSHGEFAESLGISRYEADAVLKRHGVTEDLVTPSELEEQLNNLRGLMSP